MANNKDMKTINQSRIAATNDAKNSQTGFKNVISPGGQGAGTNYRNK